MRYSISYAGQTYAWTEETDNLREFKEFINNARRGATIELNIYDRKKKRFVFWKRPLDLKPDTDEI